MRQPRRHAGAASLVGVASERLRGLEELAGVLLAEEPCEVDRAREAEDDRLLGGHGYSGDLLVGEGRQTPEPGRVLVERVDRRGQEREEEAERAHEHESREQIDRLLARALAPLQDGPPEEHTGGEVEGVLEVEQRVRVAEGGVVQPGDVPYVVRRQPREQGDGGRYAVRQAVGAPRRDSQHGERGRPLGDDDVLEQVSAQEVVARKLSERAYERGEQERERDAEAGSPPA